MNGRTALETPYSAVVTGETCYFFVFFMSEGSGLTEDFFCEIIPADEAALVGCMIVAVFIGLDHVYQKAGKVVGIGRSSDLVTDYGKFVVGFSKIYHGTDKVLCRFCRIPRQYVR